MNDSEEAQDFRIAVPDELRDWQYLDCRTQQPVNVTDDGILTLSISDHTPVFLKITRE